MVPMVHMRSLDHPPIILSNVHIKALLHMCFYKYIIYYKHDKLVFTYIKDPPPPPLLPRIPPSFFLSLYIISTCLPSPTTTRTYFPFLNLYLLLPFTTYTAYPSYPSNIYIYTIISIYLYSPLPSLIFII